MTDDTNSTGPHGDQRKTEIHRSVDNIALTMSSLEIAGLTGKRHADVLRDARKILKSINIPERKFAFSYAGEDGKTHPILNLPKRETYILVSGYSIAMRTRIVDRWLELEAAIENAAAHDAIVTALDPSVEAAIGGIVRNQLATVLPGMVENALVADVRAVAVEYKPALSILIERKVPPQKRRGFSQKVSSRLRKFSTKNGLPMRLSRETGRYLFHVDAIAKWMAKEGRGLIADHMKQDNKQTCLNLVVPIKRT